MLALRFWVFLSGLVFITCNENVLEPLAYAPLKLGSVIPEPGAWMAAQLGAQQAGLCGRGWLGGGGHVHDSNWLGGKGYNGLAESYPYWLNGAFPMAVLLRNESAVGEIRQQMAYIFAKANASTAAGWIGPLVDGSPWSTFRFLVATTQYIDATGDAVAVKAMFTFATRLLTFLQKSPLGDGSWSQSRWQELLEGYQWLLDSKYISLASENELADVWSLMHLVRQQGFDWVKWVESDEKHPFVNASHHYTPTAYIANHDISGNDISSSQFADNATHLDCEKLCNTTKACVAYVWAEKGCDAKGVIANNTCWLKFAVGPATKQACRNYRVVRNSSEDVIRGWFPTNTQDADSMGYNHWMPTINRQWVHGVNLGQAMMTWGLLFRLTGEKDYIDRGRAAWDKVMALHGQATGVFTGDETLAGTPANRGTETCGVVETMNAAGEMFQITGDVKYADQLEKIAYNALPAAFFNGTMWTLNYFQQVNKLDAMDGQPKCEEGCVYCFGMVYECCVSNHAQGWPKFVARQMHISSRGNLAVVQYFSSITTDTVTLPDKTTISSLRIDTEYPFNETITLAVQGASAAFTMELRIPGWCRSATVNGVHAPAGMFEVSVPLGNSNVVIVLPMDIRVERRPPTQLMPPPAASVPNNAATIHRGPLMYAVDRAATQDYNGVFENGNDLLPKGQFHGQNNYLLGKGEWRHALVLGNDVHPDLRFEFRAFPELPAGQGPFAAALVPGRIIGRAVSLSPTLWDVVKAGRGAATECNEGTTSIPSYSTAWSDLPPQSPIHVQGNLEPFEISLIPYGATNLRVGEIPTAVMSP